MKALLSYYKDDFRANMKLAFPIMAGQLGQTLVNLVDNLMVGKLGANALAAVSFANALFAIFFVVGMGISFALPPLISEADGARKYRRISIFFKHSLVVNTVFAIICALFIISSLGTLHAMGQDPEVVVLAQQYLYCMAISMIPYMIFQTLRSYCEGLANTWTPMAIIIIGNVLNVLFNYMLIFGYWGMPALGIEGAAIGTLSARIIMAILLFIAIWKQEALWAFVSKANYKRYNWSEIKRVLKLGIPTSMQMLFEVSAFSGAAIIMGQISSTAQAAHQIAINLASVTFMICTGIAMASTIRVGNQLGLKNKQKMRDAGISAIIQVTLIMAIFAVLFAVFRGNLPYLYLEDIAVIDIAAILLICAAIFQVPDGIQVVSLAALRGIQDVRTPTIITFISYWLIGIPISYASSIWWDWGPIGVWFGLILGLSISAILLTYRFHRLTI